jgi:regulator of protease activity HflC (stomatin/prohibitin superfamily)
MTETLMGFLMPTIWVVLVLFLAVIVLKSIYSIGPTEVGLVRKRFGKKLPGDNPIAFKGEAGY